MAGIERDAFGLPTVPPEEDAENFPFLQPDAQPEETPAEGEPAAAPAAQPAAPEAPTAPPVTPAVALPAAPEEPAAPGEEGVSEEPKKWAGKYLSPEELEKGYRHLNDQWRRTSERARAAEDYATELQERARVLEDTLQRAMPYLQRAASPQQPAAAAPQTLYDEQGQAVQVPQTQGMTPQQVAALAEQIAVERYSRMQSETQSQAAERQAYTEAETAVTGFYEAHPDVEPDSPADLELGATIRALNEAWSNQDGGTIDLSSVESLEAAYEASQRPALREVLAMNPAYFDSNTGMELARFQAALLEGQPITQQTSSVPASAVGKTAGQRKPVVERASTGSPQADADQPLDPFEEGVLAYRREQQGRGGKTVFFE